MFEAVVEMFWRTSTQIASELLIPVVAIILVMGLFYSGLGMGNRR